MDSDRVRSVSTLAALLLLSLLPCRNAHAQHANAAELDTVAAMRPAAVVADETAAGYPVFERTVLLQVQLQEKRQHHAITGAWIGGVTAGLALAIAGYSWCQDPDSPGSGNCGLESIGLFFVGSVPGSVIGGLIGYAITKRPD